MVLVEDLALPGAVAPGVFRAAYSWVELADWVPSVLAGIDDPRKVVRGICAAGHKALYERFLGRASRQEIPLRP